MSDPLDAVHLLRLIDALLPKTTSSPLPLPTDATAALVHAIHTALRFRLVQSEPEPQSDVSIPLASSSSRQEISGASENQEHDQEQEQDIDDTVSETTTAVEAGEELEAQDESQAVENRLREGWNSHAENNYSFEYKHEQSAMVFRVRVGRMGGRVQIDIMAEDGAPISISVPLTDLLDAAAFPIPSSATSPLTSATDSSGNEHSATSLGFKSIASVKAFVEQYKRDVIARLLPGLQVPGYQERTTGNSPRGPPTNAPAPARPNIPHPNPNPNPDPYLDPLRDLNPHSSINPASIGRRDLDPFANSPHSGFNPNRDGGGMLMDFNHPLFDSRRRGDDLYGGPGGSIQPPGSRWDPIGPHSGGDPVFPGPGGNPLGGVGVGDGRDRWGDDLPPPGEFGPDLGRLGGRGIGGGSRGRGGPPGFGGGVGGLGGGRNGGFGGGSGGFGGLGGGGGGGMFM